MMSGVLMALSFEPWTISMLAWFAWVPLLAQIATSPAQPRFLKAFILGWITGLTFWLISIQWLHHVTLIGMMALAIFLALYMGLWSGFVAAVRARWPGMHGVTHIGIALAGACAWVILEWLRGWFLGGFPWNFAAVSQYRNLPLIQIAAWTGPYGISFVILFFNITLWLTYCRMKHECVTTGFRFAARSWRYEFSLALFLWVGLCSVGLHFILHQQNPSKTETLKVALIQPNIPQDVKYEALSEEEQWKRLRELSEQAAIFQPDLILWPETALVDGPTYDLTSHRWLSGLLAQLQIPILLGAIDAVRNETNADGTFRWKYYNGAILAHPDGRFDPLYHKLQLVPFGEYVPFEKWLPCLKKMTPIAVSMSPGDKPVLFQHPKGRLGVLICFEDTFPSLARDISREGADILVNLTNDAWFKTSPGAMMHAANSVMRCIETHRPMVRCTNHGLTLIISPLGQILDSAEPFQTGYKCATITYQTNAGQTFYTRHGDWFIWICLAPVLFGLIFLTRSDIQK